MSHSWILRFLEHRIADKRMLRLNCEMAEGRHHGRWPHNTQQPWRSTRGGDPTDPGERLPALRVRSTSMCRDDAIDAWLSSIGRRSRFATRQEARIRFPPAASLLRTGSAAGSKGRSTRVLEVRGKRLK